MHQTLFCAGTGCSITYDKLQQQEDFSLTGGCTIQVFTALK